LFFLCCRRPLSPSAPPASSSNSFSSGNVKNCEVISFLGRLVGVFLSATVWGFPSSGRLPCYALFSFQFFFMPGAPLPGQHSFFCLFPVELLAQRCLIFRCEDGCGAVLFSPFFSLLSEHSALSSFLGGRSRAISPRGLSPPPFLPSFLHPRSSDSSSLMQILSHTFFFPPHREF